MPVSAARGLSVARLTTTEAAVLALLAIEGEHSGYELHKLVGKAIAHVWSPARSGLYAVLPRLERAGLARSRAVAQKTRPDKQVYAITKLGRRALDTWLATVEPGSPETFFLKLFVGGLTSNEKLLEHVERFRLDTAERLALYRGLEPTNTNTGHDWYHRRLLELAIARTQLELDWADQVARALAKETK
jgi:DNA-binding PadR family transcriptional regulator